MRGGVTRDQGLAVGVREFGETGVDAVHCASPSPSRGRPGWGWVCCGWEETHPLPSPPLEGEGAKCARFPRFTGPCPHGPRWYARPCRRDRTGRSEEHTSELQSLMRISYAVFCLKTKKTRKHNR